MSTMPMVKNPEANFKNLVLMLLETFLYQNKIYIYGGLCGMFTYWFNHA